MRALLHRLIFILFSAACLGQELPPFKNFSSSVYSAGNQNWDISQDSEGNLYFANEQGLLQYNGAQWSLYEMPNGSITRSVYCYQNRIYTGFYMDFGYWEQDATGNFNFTSLKSNFKGEFLEDEQFWKIYSIDNFILFQSLSGVYSYNLENEEVELITRESNIWKLFKVNDDFYYQVLGEGIFKISNKKGAVIIDSELVKEQSVVSIFEKGDDLFILFKNAQLAQYVNQSLQSLTKLIESDEFQIYSAIYFPEKERLALGTIQNGLLITDLNGSNQMQINKRNGIDNNTVLSMFRAKDGNLWLGLDNGISYVDLDSPVRQYVDQVGTLGTVYDAILNGEVLYLGTNQGLFQKEVDGSGFSPVPNVSGQVWSLSIIDDKLYCHHDSGLFVVENGAASRIFSRSGVWASWQDPESNVLFLGCYDGIYRSTDATLSKFEKLKGFDISAKDFVVFENQIFVSHEYKGLYRMDLNLASSQVENVQLLKDVNVDKTSDLQKFNDVILLSNKNGIFKYSSVSNKFEKDEKLSESVQYGGFKSGRMDVTSDNALWLFTDMYLYRVTSGNIDDNLKIESFSIDSNARDDMYGYENISSLEQDEYLIGTTFGFMTLDTSVERSITPIIQINSVEVIQQGDLEPLDLSNETVLKHNQNNLRVTYSSRVYDPLNPVLYQYRLDDENWSNWSTSSVALFNKVDHGTHTFKVRSRINLQTSPEPASFSFEISRPFYLTYTAQAIYVILLVLIGYGIHLTYKWYYKRQKERESMRHQKELEVVNLQNENDLIQMRNEKLRSENEFRSKELAVATMGTIRKNELLNEVQAIAQKLPDSAPARELRKMVKKNLTSKKDWISFEEAFNNADKDFFKKIKAKHPSLTPGDLRLCVYLRLNLSSKEIAPLLHISPRSVEIKRYRLRKKMDLDKEVNLSDYIMSV